MGNSLRDRDSRLLREIKRHRMRVKDIESFLHEELNFALIDTVELDEFNF